MVIGHWSLVIGHWSLVNDQRPTTNDQRPTTNDQRPTTNDQRLIPRRRNDDRKRVGSVAGKVRAAALDQIRAAVARTARRAQRQRQRAGDLHIRIGAAMQVLGVRDVHDRARRRRIVVVGDVAVVVDRDRLRRPAAVVPRVLEAAGLGPADGVIRPVGEPRVAGDLAVAVDREADGIRSAKRADVFDASRPSGVWAAAAAAMTSNRLMTMAAMAN